VLPFSPNIFQLDFRVCFVKELASFSEAGRKDKGVVIRSKYFLNSFEIFGTQERQVSK
jgi:hypothetical protein